MGNLVFQATLGGQVNLVGPNTASTYNLNVPTVNSTLATLAAQTFAGTQTISSGNLVFSGTSQVVTGDFSNATVASRTAFQTSTSNSTTGIYALPNGTSTAASWQATNAADPTNASKVLIATNGSTDVQLVSGRNGTGTYLPLTFYTNGSEQMRLDTSGNLGLGVTPSAWKSTSRALQVSGVSIESDQSLNTLIGTNAYRASDGSYKYIANGNAMLYQQYSAAHTWYAATSGTAGGTVSFTQAMTLDASGNLLTGGTSVSNPAGWSKGVQVYNANYPYLSIKNSTRQYDFAGYGGDLYFWDATVGAARMVIDSSGRLLVGVTSYTDGSLFKTTTETSLNAYRTSTTAAHGIFGVFSDIGGTQTVRAYFRADGGLANYSANNVNLSDERLKKDIAPAGDYLAKICAIPVKTFRYNDQSETEDLTLGVIAQEVQQIAPELVSGDGFGLNEDDKQDYLSIYQTDLQYALMKCIQEQQAIIQQLQADVAALKGQA